MKAKVNLGLSKLSIPVKIEKARHIISAITGNKNFTTPLPTLPTVTVAINELETAYGAAQSGGPTQTAIMHDKETILDNLLTQLGYYVEGVANGIDAIILSAGMDVRAKGGRKAITFSVSAGKLPNQLVLHTTAAKRHSYIWQMVTDPLPHDEQGSPPHDWEQVGVSTKASFTVSNLTPGDKYWFRVAAVGKDGQGAWSDPISKIVSD